MVAIVHANQVQSERYCFHYQDLAYDEFDELSADNKIAMFESRARKKISQTAENIESNNKKEQISPRKAKQSKVVDLAGNKTSDDLSMSFVSENTAMEVKQYCLTVADDNYASLAEKETFKAKHVKQRSYHEDDPRT